MIKRWRHQILFMLLLSLPVMACAYLSNPLTKSASPTASPVAQPAPELPAAEVDAPDGPASPTEPGPELANPNPEEDTPPVGEGQEIDAPPRVAAPAQEWPAPIAPIQPFDRTTVTVDEQAAFDSLATGRIPERDDIELARLYQGFDGLVPAVVPVDGPLPVGTIEQLNVLDQDTITIVPITAELLAVSDHAYFWFDTGPGSIRPSQGALLQASQDFDRIYERSVALFGPENNPGADGDPRLHIVTASNDALCSSGIPCLAGYYSASDSVPVVVDPESNAREMFVMHVDNFGTDFYINVLTHEMRHMIEDNYDSGDADWEVEGAATLAEDLLGLQANPINRGNLFLEQPDQQLNNWTDGYTIPHYGQGYLLNRYIYDRLGQDFYGQFAASEENGLQAIDAIAQANNLDLTGEELWLDWLVTLALHNHREAPKEYQFGVSGLNTVAMSEIDRFPAAFEESVRQYAVDYYYLDGDEDITINFMGNTLAPLFDTVPASGQWMWATNRANYSHASLTRQVDLSDVDEATLNYHVYHDIEEGYDFAYLFVSEDGGQTWQPLSSRNMSGPEDDPSGSALADSFYTARSEVWLVEEVDLTPYAGQEILIRFVYLTDPILTKGGLGLDNIAIPEIGYYDDVEATGAGWTGLGFERVTAAIPQDWHLQLITFPEGIPQVESLNLSPEQTVSHQLDLNASDDKAILVVAASAPMTLEPAFYNLGFEK